MNNLTITQSAGGLKLYEQTLDAPAKMLDTIEAASAKNESRARDFLENQTFHGAPEICDFKTLRAATHYGIETETREFTATLATMATYTGAAKLKRTDEPARIVDISAYLQGIPEAYYKTQPAPQIKFDLVIYVSAPWYIPAEYIRNRAAAIVALVKKLKAARAAVRLNIAVHDSDKGPFAYRANVNIPVNIDALNIGQFAFMTSPAFLRTYIFMLHETILNNWERPYPYDCKVGGTEEIPSNDKINFPDFYQLLIRGSTKAKRKSANIKQAEEMYGTPARAFETIEKQLNNELKRIRKQQK